MKEDFLDRIISELSAFDWKSRVDKRQAKKVIKMLEDLRKQDMSKELEALEKHDEQNDKQKKILDILKKKEVCIQMLKHVLELDKKDALEYGYTEEEYDLLKEWLNEKN
jgi:histidyl-tRNA synthetase